MKLPVELGGSATWLPSLTLPRINFTLLSDFRTRLVQGHAEHLLLESMLTLFKERGKQRTDSTHILAKVRAINRLLCVGEAMRFALNSLAIITIPRNEIDLFEAHGQ